MATPIEAAPDPAVEDVRDDLSVIREAVNVLLADEEVVRAEFEALMMASFVRPPVRLLTCVADRPPRPGVRISHLEAQSGASDGVGSRTMRARNRERSPPVSPGRSSCSYRMKGGDARA